MDTTNDTASRIDADLQKLDMRSSSACFLRHVARRSFGVRTTVAWRSGRATRAEAPKGPARHPGSRRGNLPPAEATPARGLTGSAPPSSPVCAKRSQPRAFWPRLVPAYGSQRDSRPSCRRASASSVRSCSNGSRSDIEIATGPPGAWRQPEDHRAPRGNLPFGARDEGLEPGYRLLLSSRGARPPPGRSLRPGPPELLFAPRFGPARCRAHVHRRAPLLRQVRRLVPRWRQVSGCRSACRRGCSPSGRR